MSVPSGEHPVDDDHVIGPPQRVLNALVAVMSEVDVHPLAAHDSGDKAGQLAIILHYQDSHAPIIAQEHCENIAEFSPVSQSNAKVDYLDWSP